LGDLSVLVESPPLSELVESVELAFLLCDDRVDGALVVLCWLTLVPLSLISLLGVLRETGDDSLLRFLPTADAVAGEEGERGGGEDLESLLECGELKLLKELSKAGDPGVFSAIADVVVADLAEGGRRPSRSSSLSSGNIKSMTCGEG